MKARVGEIVGGVVEGMPWLGTFHSIGVKILRRHAELVGLKPDFTILDVDDQIRLIKQLLEAENIDEKRWPARVMAMLMDGWKNRGLTPEQVPGGEAAVFANGKGLKLYKAYQERLKILNAADFGDLLLENIRLFREQPEVLRQYQTRFKFILVDEYQDTNVAQYLWLRLLAQRAGQSSAMTQSAPLSSPAGGEGSKNICCVGDDDQSIYGWRGAEVDNILRFEHDFPGATVIRLERNYRSTGHILAAASQLIAHNEGRLGKTLRTEDELGEKVTVTGAWDSEEEARAIGEEIEQLQRDGHTLNEIAILVRASFQMREFEDRFVTLGLPYRVIGGPRFYERTEIRDALAYLRVVNSPADDLAFERIVNVPKRGLGDATVQLLHEHARKRRVPLTQAVRAMIATDELKPKPRGALRGLIEALDRWRGQRDSLPHTELAEIILDESGYTEMWQKDRSADAAGRLENLKELVRSMEEFENLQGFLEHISLVMDNESAAEADAVNIMTLHSAKGLEFDTVFLPGWEEGLFPHQRTLDDSGRAGLEEERRLAHVGLTRARKRAKIYFATNRRMHGLWQTNIPSRFLDELPEPHVEVTEAQGGAFGGYGGYGSSRFDAATSFGSNYGTPGWQRAQAAKEATKGGPRGAAGFAEPDDAAHYDADDDETLRHLSPMGRGRAADSFPPPLRGRAREGGTAGRARPRMPLTIEGELVAKSTGTVSAFTLGDRVFHQKFGNGNITAIDGNKLTIQFDRAGEKRVVDSFVERV
jgi:DNA helicase-2/ATP-dependent DNA helicase PcrA